MATSVPPASRTPARPAAPRAAALLDDTALARLVASGDDRAFAVLYERHRDEVYRFCSALTREARAAEEAFQLTMLSAHRALSCGRPPRAALRSWLVRIAHDESADLLRARPGGREPATADDPVAGIAALPLRRRSALVLSELVGLSPAAVGEVLGTDAAAARRLLHEARASLAGCGTAREPACAEVRRRLGEGDRRTARARSVRAHLRGCTECAAVAATQDERRRRLAAWRPALPEPAAAAILGGILAGAETAAAAGAQPPRP